MNSLSSRYLLLGDVTVELVSDSERVHDLWSFIFAGWISSQPATATKFRLVVNEIDTWPKMDRPHKTLYSSGDNPAIGLHSAYEDENGRLMLLFKDFAFAWLTHESQPIPTVEITATQAALTYGGFEDICLVCMAPQLRSLGYYLLHSFAIERDGEAMLIVGPSGSGKTTTGLNAVFSGWNLLVNDAVLLQRRADGIYALPTPGLISLCSDTLDLLPQLTAVETADLLDISKEHTKYLPDGHHTKQVVPSSMLAKKGWGEAAKITAVCLPTVANQPKTQATEIPSSMLYAMLIQESVDRWDNASFDAHTQFLQDLSEQATPYKVMLGTNLEEIPDVLASL